MELRLLVILSDPRTGRNSVESGTEYTNRGKVLADIKSGTLYRTIEICRNILTRKANRRGKVLLTIFFKIAKC